MAALCALALARPLSVSLYRRAENMVDLAERHAARADARWSRLFCSLRYQAGEQ